MALEDEQLSGQPAGEAVEPQPTLREQLAASFAAVPADDAPVQALNPGQAEAAAAQTRGPDGKFAKAPEQGQASPEPKAALPGAEPQPTAETIRPPASWSATAKADFAKLPVHIQQEVTKREGEIEGGKAQWDQKAQRFNRLDSILGPRQERFKLAGIDETQAVQALFAAQDMLESADPRVRASAIQHLARQSGVDLRSLVQADPQQQPQAQLPPVVQQLFAEINSLKQSQAQQQTAAHQRTASETQGQLDAFAADPANVYFANVRNDMAALIRAGQAEGLKDAYDKATWANPEIRPLLLRDQQQASQATLEQQARARADAARRASGSIIGSPTPGSSPAAGGPAPSLREELARQFSSSV